MTMHPDPATLHDLVDGRLDAAATEDVTRHLEGCADCTAQVARIRALLARAATAPRAAEPARDLWPEIRARLEATRVVPLHPANTASSAPAAAPRARRRLTLLAAGITIALAASALTAVLLEWRPGAPRDVAAAGEGAREPGASVPDFTTGTVPLDAPTLDAEYAQASAELTARWRASGAPLTPATAAALDSSLRAVDAAIVEVRRAMAAAPDDPLMAEILAAAWRRKIDLLRRALALPAHT